MKRRLFTPEDKIAPGFYMNYWQAIAKKYGDQSQSINKLKAYREVRNGAILAALWTKTTGRKHFVSFPSDEPADVDIYSLEPITFHGKSSYNLNKIPIQLTRCLTSSGESVAEQVNKKNKPSLSNTSLVVHMIGEDDVKLDLKGIVDNVLALGELYPKEVALLAPIEDIQTPEQTFALLLIYSQSDNRTRLSKVHTEEHEAFFTEPQAMRSLRGTGQKFEPHDSINLQLP